MSTRRRRREFDQDDNRSQEDGGDESGLGESRREVDDLLRAGDDIIDRVLRGDSVEFLRAGRQQGGQ